MTNFNLFGLFTNMFQHYLRHHQCEYTMILSGFKRLCYAGQTVRHFKTHIQEHLFGDRSSHVFRHLSTSTECREASSAECFKILDTAQTEYESKLKAAMHIRWLNSVLNHQVTHVNLSLSLQLLYFLAIYICTCSYKLFKPTNNHCTFTLMMAQVTPKHV